MMNSLNSDQRPVRIVTMGGGSGHWVLLSSLREMAGVEISAIVSMVDSGGSTGRLRDELGILPPGDILKCILALSPQQETVLDLLQKRFQNHSRLMGHNAGNMLLAMLSRYTESFPAGVNALAEILNARGEILPVTTDQATLVAELSDGTRIYGEQAIDMPRGRQREKIKDVYLVPHHGDRVNVHPPVMAAINAADFVILGPGDLFTSTIPNLLVPGVSEALGQSGASLIHITNIMTKFGETHHFKATEFVDRLESFTGRPVDIVLYNKTRPNQLLCDLYADQASEFVEADFDDNFKNKRRIYAENLLAPSTRTIRHDAQKLSGLLRSIFDARD